MSETTHEVDGIDFVCTVAFDPGTASTLVSGMVKVYAQNTQWQNIVTGSATILSATTARGTFAGNTLPAGTYLVQMIATPAGYAPQTIYEDVWQVKKSIGTA